MVIKGINQIDFALLHFLVNHFEVPEVLGVVTAGIGGIGWCSVRTLSDPEAHLILQIEKAGVTIQDHGCQLHFFYGRYGTHEESAVDLLLILLGVDIFEESGESEAV